MTLEHVALWTNKLEVLKTYYTTFFGGVSNEKYENKTKKFASYFLTFESGSRLELMTKEGVPENLNDKVGTQHQGLIHLAFGARSKQEVNDKAEELSEAGFPILSGPRTTGDGYYEFETLDPDQNRIEVTWKA
ncbi:MAG: VOC family protein [Cyclobacteriaceae bacterium]